MRFVQASYSVCEEEGTIVSEKEKRNGKQLLVRMKRGAMGYMLLWLLGIPIPVLLINLSPTRLHLDGRVR